MRIAVHTNGCFVVDFKMSLWRSEPWWKDASLEKRRAQFALFFDRGGFQTNDVNKADFWHPREVMELKPEDYFDGITYVNGLITEVPTTIKLFLSGLPVV